VGEDLGGVEQGAEDPTLALELLAERGIAAVVLDLADARHG